MWKHVAAHALRKTAPLRLKLYIARDKRTMIRLQSSLLFIYTATHLYVPAYSPLVFFVFCLVLFLTSFEEKKSAKRRFFLSLSLFWLSFLSALLFLPGSKKNRKVYLRFTRRLRRMRVAIKSEKRTRANNRALMHRHVGKVRRKEPKETLGEGVFRRFFLFFSFERGRRGFDEERKKPKIFLEREEKEKIKLKREFSDEKENGRREKKCERGVRSIDRKRKKFDPIIELSNLNWRHNLNATYVR